MPIEAILRIEETQPRTSSFDAPSWRRKNVHIVYKEWKKNRNHYHAKPLLSEIQSKK